MAILVYEANNPSSHLDFKLYMISLVHFKNVLLQYKSQHSLKDVVLHSFRVIEGVASTKYNYFHYIFGVDNLDINHYRSGSEDRIVPGYGVNPRI